MVKKAGIMAAKLISTPHKYTFKYMTVE